MEDYKEKYEQAMLRMNKWVESSEIIDPKEVAEYIFPELKESEEERIRKMLIEQMERWKRCAEENDVKQDIEDATSALAWLENVYTEDDINRAYKCADEVQYRKGYEDAKKKLEKQGEQKPADEMMVLLRTEYEKGKADAIAEMQKYTWKPSESDILLLEMIANGKSNPQDFQASLGCLIGRLKKLREE